ncbi:cation diffusion facilitator family transporter [Vibrio mediterranei]|uniref:cation diffusion facilitator family transporter n=1 Tax=Vibrio mediterranei TaxID=689 RepID=UPI00148CB3B1|nr:cation diffusion facilitator family transporter [Vibrio mediterranei]NOH31549.1 cation transporter [Vibrio mediterranei]
MSELTRRNAVIKNTSLVSLFANVSLAALKMTAGKLGHSQALFADGLLSLSDAFVDLSALVGVRYWNKPADSDHPNGHQKLEQVISLLVGAAIAFTGLTLAHEALVTLMEATPKTSTVEPIALWVILIVLLVKGGLYVWVNGRAKKWSSTMLLANATDHKVDVISSVVPLLSILVEYYMPIHHNVDAFATLLVSGFVLYGAWNVIHSASFVLMDGQEEAIEREHIESAIRKLSLDATLVQVSYDKNEEQTTCILSVSFPSVLLLGRCWLECKKLKYYLSHHPVVPEHIQIQINIVEESL